MKFNKRCRTFKLIFVQEYLHLGIEKCRNNAGISEIVTKCGACIENQQYQQKEPLVSHEVSTDPWYKVDMDLFSYRNKDFLVVVDY